MVTAGILPFRENSYGRAGNRTRDLMISSQRLWPLDHVAGLRATNIDSCKYIAAQIAKCFYYNVISIYSQNGGTSEVPFTRHHTFIWSWFQLISYASIFGILF
jgi:hypothetical protein